MLFFLVFLISISFASATITIYNTKVDLCSTCIVYCDTTNDTCYQRDYTGDDLFPDNIKVGDAIYFGFQDETHIHSGQVRDLVLNLTEALVADNIDILWGFTSSYRGKYGIGDERTWHNFSFYMGYEPVGLFDVVDEDYRLIFERPYTWEIYSGTYGGISFPNRRWIRGKILSVTNPTTGGHFASIPYTFQDRIEANASTPADIYDADLAGQRLLLTPSLPRTFMNISKIHTAEQGALRLNFTLTNTDAGAGDTIDVLGYGADNNLISESIDVSTGNGSYMTKYAYKNVNYFNCSGFTAGTVSVRQNRWGNVWRPIPTDPYFYKVPRTHLITGVCLKVGDGDYFNMTKELLFVSCDESYQSPGIYVRQYLDIDQSILVYDSVSADAIWNRNDYGGIQLGGPWATSNYIDADMSAIVYLKANPIGQSFIDIYNEGPSGSVHYNYTMIGASSDTHMRWGQVIPDMSNSLINLGFYWMQLDRHVYDFHNSVFSGLLYFVTSASRFRNVNANEIDDQYQSNTNAYFQDVNANTWMPDADGTGTEHFRQYSLKLKIIDDDGNGIENVSVCVYDNQDRPVHYHSSTYDYYYSGNFIDVYDSSQLNVGDDITIRFVDDDVKPVREITSISPGGGYGSTDRIYLNATVQEGGWAVVYDQSPVRNNERCVLTDSNGKLDPDPPMYITYQLLNNSGTYDRGPHKIVLKHPDYRTKVIYVNMSEAKDLIIPMRGNDVQDGYIQVFGTEYCENDKGEARAFIQWGNLTPATSATVTIKLWNGSSYTMTHVENGMYQYNYTIPAYVPGGKNVYFFYINSTNPTQYGAGEFTVKNCTEGGGGAGLTDEQNATLYNISNNLIAINGTLPEDVWSYNSSFTTLKAIRTTQQNNYLAIMSDIHEVLANETYYTKLFVFDYDGKPIDAASTPNITIYDSLMNVNISEANMTKLETGIYQYNYSIGSSAMDGVWEAVIKANINGTKIQRNDYWEVETNPAQVTLSVIDTSLEEIGCQISITNEGSSAQEYYYRWWVTNVAGGQYTNAIDSGSASKLINPGETYTSTKTMTITNLGTYWCKAEVFYGTEVSGASEQFEATPSPGSGDTVKDITTPTTSAPPNKTITTYLSVVGDFGNKIYPQSGLIGWLIILFIIILCVGMWFYLKRKKEDKELESILPEIPEIRELIEE